MSAALTDPGVIVDVVSSLWGVVSPCTRRIAGLRPVAPTPLQSLMWILTGSVWPFLSLSVTGWLVIGGWNAPEPT